jgi:hypothetical protein
LKKGIIMTRVKVGKHYFPGIAVNTVLQVVAPIDNKQGVILRTISLSSGGAGGTAQISIYADLTAPPAPNDTTHRQIAVYSAPMGTFISITIPYEIEVPAGLGIWVGFYGSGQATMTYDFVDV